MPATILTAARPDLTAARPEPTMPWELPLRTIVFSAVWGAARRSRRPLPFRLDWEACAVALLMLSSAGAGLCRLLWMGQL